MSRVSVIIPSYQCARWLPATLDSCLEQKEYLKEIIVIDDHSTDGSWEVLGRYQNLYPDLVKPYPNREKGGNPARNYGFELSSGDAIQWLDADDQVKPDKFRAQLSVLDADAGVDIVYSDWELLTYDAEGQVQRREEKKNRRYADFLAELLMDNWSSPNTYLLRRSMAQRLHVAKAWNPGTKVGQDREYYTVAAILGARFCYTPGEFAVYNRWTRTSVSAAPADQRYEYQEKILHRCEMLIAEQEAIPQTKKRKYQNIINTHKLLIRAAGYSAAIHPKDGFRFSGIEWKLVHGVRTTLRVVKEALKEGF